MDDTFLEFIENKTEEELKLPPKKELKFILYGINDSIKTIEEELTMLRRFVKDGFSELKRLD